jgi:hypothetical protein
MRHPDLKEQEQARAAVAQASFFTCSILHDRRYVTLAYRSLAAARAARPIFEAKINNGRKALIYAVTDDTAIGRSFLIPDWFEP